MDVTVAHLFEHPEHVGEVARWIHEEWWSNKPGHPVETMQARLQEARDRSAVPLSLAALHAGHPVGTVNLVANDNDERPDLSPWLAALLVLPDRRGRGVGSKLVRCLVAEAARLDLQELYLGTDIPHFYSRLGATMLEEVSHEHYIMRIRMDG